MVEYGIVGCYILDFPPPEIQDSRMVGSLHWWPKRLLGFDLLPGYILFQVAVPTLCARKAARLKQQEERVEMKSLVL